jgi:hypothetical protein
MLSFALLVSYLVSHLNPHHTWRVKVVLTITRAVYFLYPETANVRLEDMNALFGDATTTMPTPATQAERGSLMGVDSPGSIDIRHGTPQPGDFGADVAIPGLEIDPPDVEIGQNGKPIYTDGPRGRNIMSEDRSEGVGGWIGRMISRTRRERSGSGSGTAVKNGYGRVGQDED